MGLRTITAAIAASLLALTLAPAAHAVGGSGTVILSAPAVAVAGVPQPLTLTITDTGGMDPSGTSASFTANGAVIATAPVTYNGSVWTATANWIPNLAGSTGLSAFWGSVSANTVYSTVTAVGTTTQVTSPSFAKLGTWVTVTVTVTATAGTLAPTGSVSLTGSGGYSQVLNLSPGSGSTSTATASYFAGTPGTVNFQATYAPGSNATLTSTSLTDSIVVNQAGSALALSLPGQITVGVPATLVVTSSATPTGFATVTANGITLANQQYFTSGRYTLTVTPSTAGTYNVNVTVTAPNGTQYSGSDTATVTAPTTPDTITLSVNGYGVLSPTTAFNAANGSVFTLLPSAASGANVTVTEIGPCVLNGNTLTIPTGSGSCTLTAVSPGGNGRAGATTAYPVSLTPGTQTSQVNPKASGKYKKGSSVYLAPVGAGTNAGQTVKWKVTSGGGNCKVVKSADSWKLKLTKSKGRSCNVKGYAPAIPGQWNAYAVYRSYTTK